MNYEQLPQLLKTEDVMRIISYKYGKASEIIRELNKELEAKGYFIVAGRVSKDYFFERLNLNKGERK